MWITEFEQKSADCHVAFLQRLRNPAAYVIVGAVRAIREGEGWRIDKAMVAAGAWLPWEPLDAGAIYPSPEVAIETIKEWAKHG